MSKFFATLQLMLIAIAALGSFTAWSGTADRIERDDLGSLLRRSERVVLADVQSLKVHDGNRDYTIKVIEVLKGTAGATSVVRLPLHPHMSASDEIAYFNSKREASERLWHDTPYFWLGRDEPYIRDVAGAIDRTIRRGRYVIFLDALNHAKGFEPIFEHRDPWYLTVKKAASNGQSGRPLRAVEFLRMFTAVHLAKCGEPDLREFRLGKLWGREIHISIGPMPDYPGPSPCEVRKNQSFLYLSLFFDTRDPAPLSVPISNGKIQFADRYGDILIIDRDVSLTAAVRALAQFEPPPRLYDSEK
jgi:hypothetical protein